MVVANILLDNIDVKKNHEKQLSDSPIECELSSEPKKKKYKQQEKNEFKKTLINSITPPFLQQNSITMETFKHKDIIDDEGIELPPLPELPKDAYKKPMEIIQDSISKVKKTYDEIISYYNKPSNYSFLADWVKTARREKKMTRSQLADKTSISMRMIEDIEYKISLPSIENVIKICNVLDINIHDFSEQLKKEAVLNFIQSIEEKHKKALEKYNIPHSIK